MTAGPNPRRQQHSVPSQQKSRQGSTTGCTSQPIASITLLTYGPMSPQDKLTSIQGKGNCRRRNNKDTRRRRRTWRRHQDSWETCRDTKWPSKKTSQRESTRSDATTSYTEEIGGFTPSDLSLMSPPSRRQGLSEDAEDSPHIEESNESSHDQLPGAEPDEGLLRHQELKRAQHQERNIAMEKYLATGDLSVFKPFMAPYIDGPDKIDLGPWEWDRGVERWRRKHELNGAIVWAPTDDMFV